MCMEVYICITLIMNFGMKWSIMVLVNNLDLNINIVKILDGSFNMF